MLLALCLLCMEATRTLLFQMLPFLERQHQVSWMVLLVIMESSRITLLGPHRPDCCLLKSGRMYLCTETMKSLIAMVLNCVFQTPVRIQSSAQVNADTSFWEGMSRESSWLRSSVCSHARAPYFS